MPQGLLSVSIDWKSLFENMTMGFSVQRLIWDENGNPVDIEYMDVNPTFEKITGISRDKAVGQRTSVLIPNLERIILEHYGKVVKTGEPTTFEQYVEGLKVYFRVYAFKTGENEFGTVFEDITKQKEITDAHSKELALINTLIDSMEDYVFYKDVNGAYVVFNEAFAKGFVGLSKNEIIGKTDTQLFSEKNPTMLKVILEKDHEVFETGVIIRNEWTTKLVKGDEVTLDTLKTPLKNEKGEIVGIVGVSRDITEKKKIESSLAKRMKELEFLNRLMVDRELKMIELKKKIEALSISKAGSLNSE